ncbi:nuclear pore complex protein Nup50 isoform X10 [Leucoraja erinacea]|uniref:nuclear pore complex protein Nup50 isoform X10 n=1 Tax=Leucoraja erinaceus TaxID=7782 RepID=UPI002455AB09|nr:nuclear pore complex protein Nup50 isoform X10 [Leucoraja erinacea]
MRGAPPFADKMAAFPQRNNTMAKRTADKELTDRNWDQEEESEEVCAGTFSVASEDVLKNRAIKKAKRRNLLAESEGGGIFKGFSGLISSTGSTGFGGFGNGSGFKPLHGLNNGNNLSLKPSHSSATDVNNPIGSFLSNGPPPNPLAKGEIDENEEDSEEPPEPVVNEIKEEDAIFSKKCKMFYKKDGDFKDKGVGTIHLKPVADQKIQLLVRADTNLGNVLLNILLHPSLPCTRTGKNNILIVCVPNPPIDEKSPDTALPILIRVKTTQDADELHKIITEKKAAL